MLKWKYKLKEMYCTVFVVGMIFSFVPTKLKYARYSAIF